MFHVSPCTPWNAWTQSLVSIDERRTTLFIIVTVGIVRATLASSKLEQDPTAVSYTTSAETGALLGRGALGGPEVISCLFNCTFPGQSSPM